MRRALCLYVIFTVVVTWPQVIQFDRVPDHVDSYFSLWRLGWIAHALVSDPARLFDGNIFHPEQNTLAYSDAILLQGAIGLPFIRSGVPVVYVYNALVLGSFVACALAMHLLVRRLTGSTPAALLAGAAFAFAPYRFDHYYHLELLWSPWIPLAFWLTHRTIDGGRLRDGLASGLCVALQVLSCIYYGVFLATTLTVFALALLAGRLTALRRRAALSLACGAIASALLVFPYMMPYWDARAVVGERNAGEASLFAAGPTHYLASLPDNLLSGHLLGASGRHEKRLFPGFVVLCLTAVALWPPLSRTTVAYALVLAVAVDLSFGPRGLGFEWLRDHVPMYRGLRAPARMGQLALFGTGVLAALGYARVQRRLAGRGIAARVALAAVLVLAWAEYLVAPRALTPVPTTAPTVYEWLRGEHGVVVAEMPMPTLSTAPLHEAEFQFLSTFHWHPLVNGYSGNWSRRHVRFLARAQRFPDREAVEALVAAGVTYVVLHERLYGRRRYREIQRQLQDRADLRDVGTFDEAGFEVAVYRLRTAVGAGPR